MGESDPSGSRGYVPGPNSNMTFTSPFKNSRRQQSYSSPTPSQTDSGYASGSGTTTPFLRQSRTQRGFFDGSSSIDCLWMYGDGYRSEDDPFVDRDETEPVKEPVRTAHAGSDSPRKRRLKNLTLLTCKTSSRPAIPALFRADSEPQPARGASDLNATRERSKSFRALDRFIPNRSNSEDTMQKFRTGKAPHELTPTEKILRHSGARGDPFRTGQRVVTPMASSSRSQTASEPSGSNIMRGL